MENTQRAKLEASIQNGAIMRDFMNHPGFDLWHKDLKALIDDVKNEWLTSDDPAKAEKVRTRAIQLNQALDIVKRRVLEGDNAKKLLTQLEDLEENQAPLNG